MKFIQNDGGRAAAGFTNKKIADDCVARAVAIASQRPYREVYDALATIQAAYRGRTSKSRKGIRSASNGINTTGEGFKRWMRSLGAEWTATMFIGQGCKVHLVDGELLSGRLVVSVSKHYTAVIDGVIHDAYDPSADRGVEIYPPSYPEDELPKGARWLENGNGWAYEPKRCVYGYWRFPS
jgi:hypothetical protein